MNGKWDYKLLSIIAGYRGFGGSIQDSNQQIDVEEYVKKHRDLTPLDKCYIKNPPYKGWVDTLYYKQGYLLHCFAPGLKYKDNKPGNEIIINDQDGYENFNKNEKWFIDPSTIITNDIKNVDGKVIVKTGTIINPLKHVSLRSTFIFYDGDSKSQVTWAIKKDKELKGKTKLILVNGLVAEQIDLFKKKIFFDQYGRITSRLKVKHTPTIAFQEGLKIRVEEVEL